MIGRNESKYINVYLSHLYNQALKAYKKGTDNLASSRNKAVWKALALVYIQEYNLALRTIGWFGSSAFIQEGTPIVPRLIDRKMLLSLEPLGEDEIDIIVDEAWKDAKRERNEITRLKRKEVVEYILQNPTIVEDAARAFEFVESVTKGQRRNFGYAPKEAQRKGGLVKQLIYQRNMPIEAAREEADRIIAGEAAEKYKPSLTKEELDKALVEVDGKPQLNYLDLLGPDPNDSIDSVDSTDTSLAPNAYLNPSEVSNDNNDFSSFDDPDDAIAVSNTKDKLQNKQEEMGSQLQSSQTSGAEDKQSATQQLLASGTATELAAKELLIKAGIKDRSKK